jgi:ADP-ribose pyrophosphatase
VSEVRQLIVDSDERVGDGGFLAVRRLRLRNQRADGSMSAQYVCDVVVRPYGQDAVIVAIYSRTPTGVQILVRHGLRPALALGRDPARAPLPEEPPPMFLTELVAGIVEDGDRGDEGLRARAASEVLEEAGFLVDQDAVVLLGAGMFPTPGCMVERFYFTAVEVDPATQSPLAGDGSPMEEGARTTWLALDDAIAGCVRGELVDLKTELGLRRLRDYLRERERRTP